MSNGSRVFRSSPRNLVGAIAGMLVFGWFLIVTIVHLIHPVTAGAEGSFMDPFGIHVTSRATVILIVVGWGVLFLLCAWFAVIWVNVTIEVNETGLVSHNVFRKEDFSAGWHEINRLEHSRSFIGDRYVLHSNTKKLKINSTFGSATEILQQLKRYAPHMMTLQN